MPSTFAHSNHFSSDAIESVLRLQKAAARHFPKAAREMTETIRLMRSAEKFNLPDDGLLLDLKSYRPEFEPMLRLPYPLVTLEFPVKTPPERGSLPSSKRIILAWTQDADTTFKMPSAPARSIYFTQVWFDDEQGEWEPSPVVWGFDPGELDITDGNFAVTGFHHFPCHPEPYERFDEQSLNQDLQSAATPLFEFCLTINCENIESELVVPPEKLGAKRKNNGREPFYSYHVLRIPVAQSGETAIAGSSLADRNSPRAHWRRGHLRRLSTGKVVWVRHTIVGTAELGRVEKSYLLEK